MSFQLHIYASLAEKERSFKAALAAKRARGEPLGNLKTLIEETRQKQLIPLKAMPLLGIQNMKKWQWIITVKAILVTKLLKP